MHFVYLKQADWSPNRSMLLHKVHLRS